MNDVVFPVAYKGFASNSLLSINAIIEIKNSIIKEVIFLKFSPIGSGNSGYDTFNKIELAFDSIDLRALAYACKDIIKQPFDDEKKKYSSYTHKTPKKSIYLVCERKVFESHTSDTYYINAKENKTIGVGFNKFELMGFCDTLMNIANESEIALFKTQRVKKKKA